MRLINKGPHPTVEGVTVLHLVWPCGLLHPQPQKYHEILVGTRIERFFAMVLQQPILVAGIPTGKEGES